MAGFVRKEIEPLLRQQIAEGREILHLAFEDERCGLELTINQSNSPYNGSSYAAYDVPTIKDQNPLYNALRSKAKQLRGGWWARRSDCRRQRLPNDGRPWWGMGRG